VAAPVFDHVGKVCAGLCVSGLIQRMRQGKTERIKNAVIKYAREITDGLRSGT